MSESEAITERRTVIIAEETAGLRLDRALAHGIPGVSRARIQALIRQGAVACAGRTIGDGAERVKPGERYEVTLPPPVAAEPVGQALALDIVHEDRHLIVIDKPAGLVVHPAPGHADGTLVNALVAHCGESLSGIGGVRRPGIVHRLDKDTSGLLVVAKSDVAHQGLAEQFAAHGRDGRMSRGYVALVWGVPDRRVGRIEAALARSTANRTRMAVASVERGRAAATRWTLEQAFADEQGKPLAARLSLELETGRTHQIRVHLAHIDHPVMGDRTYGAGYAASARRLDPESLAAYEALDRQALHAARLGFEHPVTGKRIDLESPLPADMAVLVAALARYEIATAPRRGRR